MAFVKINEIFDGHCADKNVSIRGWVDVGILPKLLGDVELLVDGSEQNHFVSFGYLQMLS